MNDGAAATSGEITLWDTLPKGVVVTSITGAADQAPQQLSVELSCAQATQESVVTVTCRTLASVPAGRMIAMKISVNIPGEASGTLVNSATISGGGAATDSVTGSTPVTLAGVDAPFGVSAATDLVSSDGTPDVQAGSHPYDYTTMLAYNSAGVDHQEKCGAEFASSRYTQSCPTQVGSPDDVEVTLPPGMVGDPTAVPRCSQQQFQSAGYAECPAATQVGVVDLVFYNSELTTQQMVPVYNIVPPSGQPAELGFSVSTIGHVAMLFHAGPRPDGQYALTASVSQITQFLNVRALAMTIWGVPAEESHTPLRMSAAEGAECSGGTPLSGGCVSRAADTPFLTLPSSCSVEPLVVAVGADSWQQQSTLPLPTSTEAELTGISGCEFLSLGEPGLSVEPISDQASAPSGYAVRLRVPQVNEPEALATPDIRNVEVTMPEGTSISPSAANGLRACTEAEFERLSEQSGHCPVQAKIGTVKIASPLIDEPLTGSVYVGAPECSPCTTAQIEEGKMVKLLIEAKLPNPNESEMSQREREAYRPPVLIKLAGRTQINHVNGQLTTTFADNPQLPFEELTLELENGQDAPLVNPSICGPIHAVAQMTAWSAVTDGEGKVTDPASTAEIEAPVAQIAGCSHSAFTPTFSAGMTTSQRGGAFSGFVFTLSRPDDQQVLGAVTTRMPPGLAAMLAKVTPCAEPQANEGSCPVTSQIGTTATVVGPGSEPYTINGGRVYLTGPYGGGSFGLSIVAPAEAGPFHLAGLTGAGGEGNGSVVVRAAIHIDPHTAAVTISTNSLPTQLDGIPLDIQRIIVEVNRPEFMFNPTDCEAMQIEGTITSASQTTSNVSYPFQSVDCARLGFKPSFMVKTHAGHTRRFGAYLHVAVGSSAGQANIKSVFVELPKVFPSRTETLKLACSAAQFAINPGGCPAGSYVGTAVAHTPVLPVPLIGPAIFVSHGGSAFPDLDVVLQGDNVTVDLSGSTDIERNITSSDFKSVPDVPVNSFELTLPTGAHSALAATANLCFVKVAKSVRTRLHGRTVYRKRTIAKKRTLLMPTVITGQNGAVERQSTKIVVEGCASSKGRAAKR